MEKILWYLSQGGGVRRIGDVSVSTEGDGFDTSGEVGSLDTVGDSLLIQDTKGL